MEVLSRVKFAAPTCSISEGSSSPTHAQVGQSSSSLFVAVSRRPHAFVGSLLASTVSVIASVPAGLALNYDEFVKGGSNAAASATSAADSFSFDVPDIIDFDAATDFMSSNPVAALAGLAAVAVPLIAFRASAAPQNFGSVSALEAFTKLSDPEQNAQLLDIRAPEDIKSEGTPNLKSLRKKAVQVPYTAADDSFLDKVFAKYRDAENTTVYILDQLDGNSLAVAKILANNGFEKAYSIKGGVEGPKGWLSSELPWQLPRKGFSLDLSGLKDLLSGNADPSLVPTTLGAAAAAGIGVAVFTEAETVLQLLGSAAFVQIFFKKFMFAEDREKTVKEIQTFLDTKIAPKEFVDEIKEVGRVLLPKDGESSSAVTKGDGASVNSSKVDSVAVGDRKSVV